jgi:hypothetical protein
MLELKNLLKLVLRELHLEQDPQQPMYIFPPIPFLQFVRFHRSIAAEDATIVTMIND